MLVQESSCHLPTRAYNRTNPKNNYAEDGPNE